MFERIKAELREIKEAIKDDTPRCIGCGRCGAAIPSKNGKTGEPFVCILQQRRKRK
jgi:Fe-S-cluster-containing hydrogenase component 2